MIRLWGRRIKRQGAKGAKKPRKAGRMPSGRSNEPQIEDAIFTSPDVLGFPGATGIRNVRLDASRRGGSGFLDVMLLPDHSQIKVVLVEVKVSKAKDATDKVVGQLLKYYASALNLGSDAIDRYQAYANDNPVGPSTEQAGRKKATLNKIYDGLTLREIQPLLSLGARLRPEQVQLFIALDDDPSPILQDTLEVLSDVHRLPIGLLKVVGQQVILHRPAC